MAHNLVWQRKVEADLRRTEEQLRQAQRMDAIGRLAGGIAHDFNNLLSVILSYSGMIAQDPELAEPLRADVQEISRAAERAAELTKQLLAFSRQQVLAPTVIDVNAVIDGMEKLLGRLIGEGVTPLAAPVAQPRQGAR